MSQRSLSLIAGSGYLLIFFAAIFGNFLALESLTKAPLATVLEQPALVRAGIVAFLVTVVFDVVVAWALFELFKSHPLSGLSMLFRMMHAAIMGVAIYALPPVLQSTNEGDILSHVQDFNTIWLIGLFFFGIHLILLGSILRQPRFIAAFLVLAGTMYMIDTVAHFALASYADYESAFLIAVAIPSIVGEMSLAIWLLRRR